MRSLSHRTRRFSPRSARRPRTTTLLPCLPSDLAFSQHTSTSRYVLPDPRLHQSVLLHASHSPAEPLFGLTLLLPLPPHCAHLAPPPADIDEFFLLPHIVHPGETISSSSLTRRPGGKGANQACSVARSSGGAVTRASNLPALSAIALAGGLSGRDLARG